MCSNKFIVLILLVILLTIISLTSTGFCVDKKLFTLRIGEPDQDIFVELKEFEQGKRYSIYSVNFKNRNNWGPVAGGLIETCSIRKMAERKGFNWYAESQNYKGNNLHTLIIYLNSQKENIRNALSTDPLFNSANDIEISRISAIKDPSQIVDGKDFYKEVCRKLLNNAKYNY